MDLCVSKFQVNNDRKTYFLIEATVGSRKTETWYRYSDIRPLAEPLKATAEKCGYLRLPHFPSRFTENRSEAGLEQRRLMLDRYFSAVGSWPQYPRYLLKFVKAVVPEENILDFQNTEDQAINSKIPIFPAPIPKGSIFYNGNSKFDDYDDSISDIVVGALFD
ncbi:Oidioi.mRNA.OKI2018_I69.chr1.g1499.t1.cds [Oikopleura dioica]|uniref:Oidioi.mRNA.OKI2018_I69.chr1.g1499.t1.cds n=1 Tax=Oikopleura dioica TaxID=34765 RepID=A0ABN7SNM2_OIKDI|nr:Oidioi.mRNA.OKI2018_I69.chr1.g1499.t1.cds [Oikopleura dioica]